MEREKKDIIRKQKRTITIIMIILFISALLFFFVMYKLIKENSRCMQDPFTYAANRIIITSDEIDLSISEPICVCDMGVAGSFYFDKEGIYKENPRYAGLVGNTSIKIFSESVGS